MIPQVDLRCTGYSSGAVPDGVSHRIIGTYDMRETYVTRSLRDDLIVFFDLGIL